MGENSDDNDPFEEDIVFDQSGLLTNRSYSRQQMNNGFIPTFMLFIRTVFLCVAFIGLGLCGSVSQGPLIHLEVAVGIPTEKAFHSFTAHCIGMLIGGLLGSVLFEIYNRQFLIFVSLMWMSFSISVLPFTIPVSYWWTLINLAALGIGLAFLFTGSNILCLDLWGKQGGASLQSLHFSFAVGAFIAPILIQPFISGTYPAEFGGENIANSTLPPISTLSPPPPAADHRMKREVANVSSIGDFSFREIQVNNLNDSLKSLILPNVSIEIQRIDLNKSVDGPPVSAKLTVTESPILDDASSSIPTWKSSASLQKGGLDSNNTEAGKVPKPKPSFTNANLIPEHSKWERLPQKEFSKEPAQKTDGSNTEKVTSISSDSNASTSVMIISSSTVHTLSHGFPFADNHTTSSKYEIHRNATGNPLINQTISSTVDPRNVPRNDTDQGVTIATSEIMNASPSRSENTEKNISAISLLSSKDSVSNMAQSSIHSFEGFTAISHHADDDKREESIYVHNADFTTTTIPSGIFDASSESNQNMSLIQIDAKTTSSLSRGELTETTPENASSDGQMFVINFSNHSDSDLADKSVDDLYIDEFPRNSFSDYSAVNAVGGKIVKEQTMPNEPELLDLKESPAQDDEASTISMTASFPSEEMTLHHHHVQGHQSKPGTFSNISDTNSRFLEGLVERFKHYGVTSIHFVYICVGIFLLLNAFVSVVIMCHNPREPRSKQEDLSTASLQRARVRLFFVVFSIYMFMAEALQGAVHHLLASIHTENGLPTANRSVDGAAMFWGLVCATRFLCILVSGCLRVRPSKILVVSTFLMVLGTVFFCVGTFNKQDFLWGGIIIVAIGLAPVLPTSFLWMAELMRVSHRMCAVMIVISSFGNSLTHTTLTHVLANSHLYAYILIGISVCSVAFLCISFCLLFRAQSSKSLAVPVGYQLANQEEDEALELTRPTPKNFDTMSRRLSDMGEAGQALLID